MPKFDTDNYEAVTSVNDTDLFLIVQDGETKKITSEQLQDALMHPDDL